MNHKAIIVVGGLLALVVGHDIGVYRANKRGREIVAKKNETIDKIILRNQALSRYVERTLDEKANIRAARHLVDDIKFIKVVAPK